MGLNNNDFLAVVAVPAVLLASHHLLASINLLRPFVIDTSGDAFTAIQLSDAALPTQSVPDDPNLFR